VGVDLGGFFVRWRRSIAKNAMVMQWHTEHKRHGKFILVWASAE
jgi:hypothetical protein